MTAWIIAAVIIFTVLPLIAFRDRTLLLYARFDFVTYLLAWLLYRQFPAIDPFLGLAAVGVAKLAVFSLFLANGESVRWTANRAAAIGLLVYALVVPAMLRVPIDGDEPYYLLLTESLVRDGDVDLSNQYQHLEKFAVGRPDLRPQVGDPIGPRGQQYSRHEPFLSLLLIPGYLAAGVPGAVATIVLFAALFLRSTMRFFEEEGIPERTSRAMFPFIAFGPPILFYATRIWAEVPAAFLFVEAIRGVRNRRPLKWIGALFFLTLLKLRFLLVAAPLLYRAIGRNRGPADRFRDRGHSAGRGLVRLRQRDERSFHPGCAPARPNPIPQRPFRTAARWQVRSSLSSPDLPSRRPRHCALAIHTRGFPPRSLRVVDLSVLPDSEIGVAWRLVAAAPLHRLPDSGAGPRCRGAVGEMVAGGHFPDRALDSRSRCARPGVSMAFVSHRERRKRGGGVAFAHVSR